MKIHPIAVYTIVMASATFPLIVGCGSNSSSTAQTEPRAADQAVEALGSASTVVDDGAETEPAQSVAIFLDSLRSGNERAANGVLTSLARQELAKTAYVIQPLGTPAGKYRIGRVVFPYEEKNVALVECTWIEPPTSGEPEEVMELVGEVHKEPEGWRISAMHVSVPGVEEALVLDFEDAASLQATIDAATGAAPQVQAVQAAQADVGQSTFPVNLPSYPSGGVPSGVPSEGPAFPQMALPPLNSAPINR